MKYIHPKRALRLTREGLYRLFWYYLVPDRLSIRHSFREKVGYECNLKDPQSYNEKIQWLKLHDRKPFYKDLCDKYKAKAIIGDVIGGEYIIPTLGRWDKFDDIDFTALPDSFVLKCNHDSANTIIVRDKASFDYDTARTRLSNALKTDYYHDLGKQWAYKGIERCIIAEPLLKNDDSSELMDYKYLVFNGKCKCTLVSSERFSSTGVKMDFYDTDWNLMPFIRHYPNSKDGVPKPEGYGLMVSLAEKIARFIDNPFIRVDFYQVGSKVYFGEATFYPGGGMSEFTPREWDFILGSWIDLEHKTSDLVQ